MWTSSRMCRFIIDLHYSASPGASRGDQSTGTRREARGHIHLHLHGSCLEVVVLATRGMSLAASPAAFLFGKAKHGKANTWHQPRSVGDGPGLHGHVGVLR